MLLVHNIYLNIISSSSDIMSKTTRNYTIVYCYGVYAGKQHQTLNAQKMKIGGTFYGYTRKHLEMSSYIVAK